MTGKEPARRSMASREVRSRLNRLGLKARKGLGQHFLTDRRVIGKIMRAAQIETSDTVIEVGPGLGVLTEELDRQAGQVVCVELDTELTRELDAQFAGVGRTRVVCSDILQETPKRLLPAGTTRYKLVANLPYYIASAVIRHFLEDDFPPELMVVMLQKEVAGAITASPGRMSLASIAVQIFGQPEIVAEVPATSFYPRPKVDSAVLRIRLFDRPVVPLAQQASFFSLVRAAFGSPRKQMANNLSLGLDINKQLALQKLDKAGVEPGWRPGQLSVDDWINLWQIVVEDEDR